MKATYRTIKNLPSLSLAPHVAHVDRVYATIAPQSNGAVKSQARRGNAPEVAVGAADDCQPGEPSVVRSVSRPFHGAGAGSQARNFPTTPSPPSWPSSCSSSSLLWRLASPASPVSHEDWIKFWEQANLIRECALPARGHGLGQAEPLPLDDFLIAKATARRHMLGYWRRSPRAM
jgi:hypothetical protein